MTRTIVAKPLAADSFAPFGEVIEIGGGNDHYFINAGRAERYHALAKADAQGPNAHVLISTVRAQPIERPLQITLVERHPLGSQAFIPLEPRPFLIVVCRDTANGPGEPQAFVTGPGQGINYARNVWHGLLAPIGEPQDFAIVDRGGDGINLEEHVFAEPYEIVLPD